MTYDPVPAPAAIVSHFGVPQVLDMSFCPKVERCQQAWPLLVGRLTNKAVYLQQLSAVVWGGIDHSWH